MVNKCAAPGCDTGYKRAKKNEDPGPSDGDPGPSEEEHVSCFHFPSNEERMKIWESKVPREGFKATKYSVLYEKHSTPNDFQIESIEISNKWRAQKKGKTLQRNFLTEDTVPSLWPNCPQHLSNPQIYIRPTRLSTSSAREEKIASDIKLREEEEKLWDTYSSLDELGVKITNMNLPTGVQNIKHEHQHLYINITSEGESQIKYCLKILDTLEFEMWCNNKKLIIVQ